MSSSLSELRVEKLRVCLDDRYGRTQLVNDQANQLVVAGWLVLANEQRPKGIRQCAPITGIVADALHAVLSG